MIHLDLFSGIGGFAYATEQVWSKVEHVFCDSDPFCRAVLSKHWPRSYIYDDIKKITFRFTTQLDLLTGGFPCQPFSAAGLRRGTADDRHLWPEMLRVIRLTEPEWVIAENVRGILTWNEGLVFEQVCADLEAAGYEVQPFIIPAVAVNAPHRRDRVWFVGHNTDPNKHRLQKSWPEQQTKRYRQFDETAWDTDWSEVAAKLCGVDDGLPVELDGLKLSKSQHRKEQLKAYGNSIVPQVAMEIMRGMK